MQKTENIIIRKAEKSDIKSIALLEKLCFSCPWSEQAIAESFESENTYFSVAEENKCIWGYAGMYIAFGEGYMFNTAVHPDRRRRGIGELIMLDIIEYCKIRVADFLSLEVRKSNSKALEMYEKLEFVRVGIRKNFYSRPTEDAVIMTRYFK